MILLFFYSGTILSCVSLWSIKTFSVAGICYPFHFHNVVTYIAPRMLWKPSNVTSYKTLYWRQHVSYSHVEFTWGHFVMWKPCNFGFISLQILIEAYRARLHSQDDVLKADLHYHVHCSKRHAPQQSPEGAPNYNTQVASREIRVHTWTVQPIATCSNVGQPCNVHSRTLVRCSELMGV